ncbi:MAG: enoyl-CoA hydratase-related protein [Thermodesulfobacteriota bacterium]
MKYVKEHIDERNVARLALNRPEIHNAFNDELIRELTGRVDELNRDERLRLMVLTGEGKSFCAGADLNWMKSMKDYSLDENIRDSEKLDGLFAAIRRSPVPVIGLINGPAFGGGTGLVSVCDYAAAVESALFGFTETRLGLVPAVISPYVMEKIGAASARAWFLSGERFDARTARQINLVDEIVPEEKLKQRGEEIIAGFLKAAPEAQRHAKTLIREVERLRKNGDDAAVRKYTTGLIAKLRVSDEGQEGMAALLEKRKPSWLE